MANKNNLCIIHYPFQNPVNVQCNQKAINWPVVYLIEDGKQIYIGETNNFLIRMGQHFSDSIKSNLTTVHMIVDDEFNKSAIRDIEATLISYFDAEKKYKLLNTIIGVVDHNYFNRIQYKNKVPVIWDMIRHIRLSNKEIFELENSILFKFSPYKALSEEQFEISSLIIQEVKNNSRSISFVEGEPGTGKTILAMYLLKLLSHIKAKENKKVALVIAMSSLRNSLQKVAKQINGLSIHSVIGPYDVIKDEYDTLIVDEAHRLRRRKGVIAPPQFDRVNRILCLTNGTQLDWVIKSSKHQVFFYDENQSVIPGDVRKSDFINLKCENQSIITQYTLYNQQRVKGGSEYAGYIRKIINGEKLSKLSLSDYKVKLYDDFKSLYSDFKNLQKEVELVRMVSGYSFEWKSKRDSQMYDIEIAGIQLRWNSILNDWPNSPKAPDEVGCIHTVQGYDLNYVAVIFGYEIDYDFSLKQIIINKDKYYDINGKKALESEFELITYIKNIYITLMTRGIYGVQIYACNENFRKYLHHYL